MATTVTINSKTPTSINITVTRTAGTTTIVNIGPGTTWQNVIANAVITDTITTSQPATVTLTYSSSLSSNTQYGVVAYELGGGESEISAVSDATLPAPQFLAQNIVSVGIDEATVSVTTAPDDGYYAKQIQYSLDSGSTWTTGATVNTGSQTTTTFVISGLNVSTAYTSKIRVNTTAGVTNCPDVSFVTSSPTRKKKLVGSSGGYATSVNAFFGSSSGNAHRIMKFYGSENGQAQRIF